MKLMILGLLGAVALSGCDHYSNKMAENSAIMAMPAAGGMASEYGVYSESDAQDAAFIVDNRSFSSYLAAEYHNLALYEQNQAYDYKAAALYTKKASQLNEGQMVGPVSLRTVRLPEALKAELEENRFFLIEMIKDYGYPENRQDFAVAQTRFDCWVDQATEQPNNPASHSCKAQFDRALVNVFLREESSMDSLLES